MAYSFLLVSLSSLALLSCSNADFIANICSQSTAITPVSCARILRSDPHSRGADLVTLGQIAIRKAKVAVKDTVRVSKSMVDANNKGAVSVCVRVCDTAIEELTTVSEELNKGSNKIADIRITLSGAATFVGTCDDAFAENPGGEPAEVEEASRIAQGLIIIVLTIADMLP